MRSAVERLVGEEVVARFQHAEERRRDGGHAARRDERRLGPFQRGDLGVKGDMVRRVGEPRVADVVVATVVRRLEGR